MYYLCFVLLLVAPVFMFFMGFRWRKNPPAFQSEGLVYRTELTEKSPEVWEFAHVHCGKLWSRFGGIFVVISAALVVSSKGFSPQAVNTVANTIKNASVRVKTLVFIFIKSSV